MPFIGSYEKYAGSIIMQLKKKQEQDMLLSPYFLQMWLLAYL